MSVLKNFENTPGRPTQGRQGFCRPSNGDRILMYFFLNLQRGPWPGGGGLSPPPTGDRGSPTLYKLWPPFPSHLSPKIQKKKRGVRRRKAAKPCEFRTCDLPVTSV